MQEVFPRTEQVQLADLQLIADSLVLFEVRIGQPRALACKGRRSC